MSFHLAARLGTIGVLILLLLIPVAMIDGLISERQALRDQVLADIARSSSSAQRLSGPILVAPYRKTVREWVMRPDTREHVQEEREVSGRLYFLPDRFALDAKLANRGAGARHPSGPPVSSLMVGSVVIFRYRPSGAWLRNGRTINSTPPFSPWASATFAALATA